VGREEPKSLRFHAAWSALDPGEAHRPAVIRVILSGSILILAWRPDTEAAAR